MNDASTKKIVRPATFQHMTAVLVQLWVAQIRFSLMDPTEMEIPSAESSHQHAGSCSPLHFRSNDLEILVKRLQVIFCGRHSAQFQIDPVEDSLRARSSWAHLAHKSFHSECIIWNLSGKKVPSRASMQDKCHSNHHDRVNSSEHNDHSSLYHLGFSTLNHPIQRYPKIRVQWYHRIHKRFACFSHLRV